MSESFAELFEQSLAGQSMQPGAIVKARVLEVKPDVVIVDAGLKSEGVIPISEFPSQNGELSVRVGDEIEVALETVEDGFGETRLSKEKAERIRTWDVLERAFEKKEIVTGIITGKVKGGFTVDIGSVRAFLPGSLVDVRPVRDTAYLEGKPLEFKIIKLDRQRNNVVVSRREVLEAEYSAERSLLLDKLQEGVVLRGVVKNLVEYGAFVDLGGIDGLLHITDMSWGRVNHPSEVFKIGDEVTVKVLRYNAETERVSLGLKQTMDDPWEHASESYPIGKRIRGKVVSITDYGAFVEMEQGIEGLIHVSEMSWGKPKHPSKVVEVGQVVDCQVLEVDPEAKRISLGLKQLAPDPWHQFASKYNPGDIIRGKVRSLTDYGVFVGIEDGVDGMVHKSDLSWTQRINNPADLYKKGDEVEAIILSINHAEKKVSLGIKQLYEDPWLRLPDNYPVGTILEVRVKSVAEFGIFVEIERGVEGLIHVSELSMDWAADPGSHVKEGDIIKAEIISMDPSERRIALSLRRVSEREEDVEAMKFMEKAREDGGRKATGPSGSSGATLGDVLKGKLENLTKE